MAKSIMQSMRSNHAYSAKALKKLKKSLASKSRKTQSVISRKQRGAASGRGHPAGSWDDGHVGTWATSHSRQPDYAGDADGDITMDNELIEFDRRSYPPLDKPQNMNAMAQCWEIQSSQWVNWP